jgi:hypothetical protein
LVRPIVLMRRLVLGRRGKCVVKMLTTPLS